MSSADAASSSATLKVVDPYDLSPVETLAAHGRDDAERAPSIAYGLFRDRERWLDERVSVSIAPPGSLKSR